VGRRAGALALLAVVALLPACASRSLNTRLAVYDARAGYRYANLTAEGRGDELLVILAFSGGGTRAAAFSFGLMEALREARYASDRGPRRLLDDVDVIASVSGGSFTAAYYALFRERLFDDFPAAFLHRDIEGELIGRALWPPNWLRLARTDFDRINLAAELYDETVFQGRTFADLLREPRRPYLIVNATDMTLGRRFEFTQDQFDLLCSDLSTLKVADAVAASSAFPGLLSPLTVRNFAGQPCGWTPPPWLQSANRPDNPPPRYLRARDLLSYQREADRRPWIHLLDGGLADNIGLRGPYVALSSQDSSWSVLSRVNQGITRRVVVISANAKTKSRPPWDRRQAAPGLLSVLGLVSSGPMDNYSLDTEQLIRDAFAQNQQDEKSATNCRKALLATCGRADIPEVPHVDWYAVELAFDRLGDEALRECLESLPTSFTLPEATVTLLRQAARVLLQGSSEFARLMRDLDKDWQPTTAAVDPKVRAAVCGGR
jgi:predicted acylesterase/phospholipase RssA